MDASDRIGDQIVRAVGNLDATDPIARPARAAVERVKAVLATDEALEVLARAHDAEEGSHRGEPSLWAIHDRGDWMEDFPDPKMAEVGFQSWRAERLAAMRCALQAVGLA